ncbi:MAG: tRNA preQ1(34) S-adenosylmethionine ribosyltransferase-isomerase QueA [Candidatus Peribacteraceae bacterium]
MQSPSFTEVLRAYDYPFPPELIAKEPARPRDSARLMVYDRKNDTVTLDTFRNIAKYLPKNSVIVFNQSKVLPAKFTLEKSTGGKVEALFLEEQGNAALILASGKFAEGDTLKHDSGEEFLVQNRKDHTALIYNKKFEHNFVSFLEEHGTTPLPPYIKNSPLNEAERRTEYQTVFANEEGSVAAPTAGLHFTKELITELERNGHQILSITLHVQLGTFAPITEAQWQSKTLHTEHYSIDAKTCRALEEAKKSGSKIIAVGTTTLRTLESASENGSITKPSGRTNLFLREGDSLHFVDSLITNFHVPRSSLLMLVACMTGRERLMKLYAEAIENKFRLFSFGDGMLVL